MSAYRRPSASKCENPSSIVMPRRFSSGSRSVRAPVSAGEHTVELRKKGDGPIYFNGYLTNFTLEDDIQAAGLDLKINRKFYKLTPAEKTAATAGGRGEAIEQRVGDSRIIQILVPGADRKLARD